MKKIRYFVETRAVKLLAWLMRTLPRHAGLAFTRVVGTLAYAADARGRCTALENLRVALPALSWAQRHRVVLLTYQNFARTFGDLFWCSTIQRDDWQRHFVFDLAEPDALERAQAGGAVWVTPHFGNFEMSSLVWGYLGMRYTIVAQNFKNPALTDIFTQARETSGHDVIPQQSAMLRLTKALARGSNAGFLTDLNVKPGRAASVIECFCMKTCVTTLHVLLAQRLKLPIQPALCLPLEDGRYQVKLLPRFSPAADTPPQVVAQQCWDLFEKEIRARPDLWMWMYKHWRYLPDEAQRQRYPGYANVSKDFVKMLNA